MLNMLDKYTIVRTYYIYSIDTKSLARQRKNHRQGSDATKSEYSQHSPEETSPSAALTTAPGNERIVIG